MGILTDEQTARVSGTTFEQVGAQCQAASDLTQQRYKWVTGLYNSLPVKTEGNSPQNYVKMLRENDPSGEGHDILLQVTRNKGTRQTVFSSVLDTEEWNQKDASGKISKYELLISYCVFDQILEGILQEPADSPENLPPCRKITPGQKVEIIQAIGNTAYISLNGQTCTLIQALTAACAIWGWKVHELPRGAAAETFPVLRQYYIRWVGSEIGPRECIQAPDPAGWEWIPDERLIQAMSQGNPAQALLFFLTKLPWCVLGAFGMQEIHLGALLSVTAQAICSVHKSGQVTEWIHQEFPKPCAQPPYQSVAFSFTEQISEYPSPVPHPPQKKRDEAGNSVENISMVPE